MSDDQAPHPEFAQWYQAVHVGDPGDRRNLRWQGLTGLLAELDRSRVEALARLSYAAKPSAAAPVVQQIRQSFRDSDETFEMSGNDRELQVLSAAALAVLIGDESAELAPVAALAVTTASFMASRVPTLPMDLATLGESGVAHHAHARRRRPDLAEFRTPYAAKLDFARSVAKVSGQSDWAGVAAAFSLAAEDTKAYLLALAKKQSRAFSSLDAYIRVQDEELQMLWWLTGQRSERYNCSFKAVPAEAQPIVFGAELAEHTATLPGPPSIRGIMAKAGVKARLKLTAPAAVQACNIDLLESLVSSGDHSLLTTPLHAAMVRQLETGPGDSWVPGWAAAAGLNATIEYSALDLADQFYRERLLATWE